MSTRSWRSNGTEGLVLAVAALCSCPPLTFGQIPPGQVLSHGKLSGLNSPLSQEIQSGDRFGFSVASLGDLNGDGNPDLAVGAYKDDTTGTDEGAVYVLFLDATGSVSHFTKLAEGLGGFGGEIEGPALFGSSVALLGNLDADSNPEIAIGSWRDTGGGSNRGAVWIVSLDAGGSAIQEVKVSAETPPLSTSVDDASLFGYSVTTLGDVDGDGVLDMAVGGPGHDDGGPTAGAVWIVFLNPDASVKGYQKISQSSGGLDAVLSEGVNFGISVDGLGDFDQDGIPDLAVGAFLDDGGTDRGGCFLLMLHSDGTVKATRRISSTHGGFTGMLADGDNFGRSVRCLGDLDGDGVVDLSVGAFQSGHEGYRPGSVWTLFLRADGTVKRHLQIGAGLGSFAGQLDHGDAFGAAQALVPAFDGSENPGLIVSAPDDDDGVTDGGALWLLTLAGAAAPRSTSVLDVPGDQGGFVRVSWLASALDVASSSEPVTEYSVHVLTDEWGQLVELPATMEPDYSVVIATAAIEGPAQPEPWVNYRVVAHTNDANLRFESSIVSGYSVDNIAPQVSLMPVYENPSLFVISAQLSDEVGDLDQICWYRGTDPEFVPGAPLVCSAEPSYVDYSASYFYFKAQATDIHGNVGEFSSAVARLDPTSAPPQFIGPSFRVVSRNPGPLPARVAWVLPAPAQAKIEILDLRGRRVVTLADRQYAEGFGAAQWDGTDFGGHAVANGVYYVRFSSDGYSRVRRLVVVR